MIQTLAMTFGESMMQPIWDDPGRFASPAYIGVLMGLWALWKGSKEVAEFVAAAKKVWPIIAELLVKFRDNQPVQPVVPAPVVQADTAAEIAKLKAELAALKSQPKASPPAPPAV